MDQWLFSRVERYFTILIKQTYPLLGVAVFILSSIYILLLSESGFLERLRLNNKINIVEKKVQELKRENESLKLLLERQEKGYLSKDDLLLSGQISDGEKAVFIKHRSYETESNSTAENEQTRIMDITIFRIAWILFSIFIIAILYKKTKTLICDDI